MGLHIDAATATNELYTDSGYWIDALVSGPFLVAEPKKPAGVRSARPEPSYWFFAILNQVFVGFEGIICTGA